MIHGLRRATRTLVRQPGFSLSVCLILGVGVGLSAALVCVVESLILRPPPYLQSERLVQIWETNDAHGGARHGPAPGNVHDWRAGARTLEKISTLWLWRWMTIPGDGAFDAEQVRGAMVTADFFSVLGVEPVLGRTFSSEEVVREEPVLVLSYELWQRRFGGAVDVVDSSVRTRDRAWRIIGVMPAGFRAPGLAPGDLQYFEPWDFEHRYARLPLIPRDWRFARSIARLGPGVSLDQATAELNGIAARLAEAHPETNYGWGAEIEPIGENGREARTAFLVLLGASGLMVLLACASASSFLLVRAVGRGREMAVRMALGATRLRRIGEILSESVLLAGAGGALGLIVAQLCVAIFQKLEPGGLAEIHQTGLAARVLVATLGVMVLTAALVAVASAVQGALGHGSRCLRSERGLSDGRGLRRLVQWIVVTQVALALMLLVGSGLLLHSFQRVLDVDPGFDPENLLVARMRLDAEYLSSADEYFDELIEELKSLPGVINAGGVTALPMDELDVDFDRTYWRDGEQRPLGGGPGVNVRVATVGYFETMRIPLLDGRTIHEDDDGTKPHVLVVSESMARWTWPGENPLGKRLRLHYQGYTEPYEVVGIVGDTRAYGRKSDPEAAVYVPHKQSPYLLMNIVIRSGMSTSGLVSAVRRTVFEIDEDQPVQSIETMAVLIRGWERWDRLAAVLMSTFGVIGLLLATVGTYSLVFFSLRRRSHEIGVRLALGAEKRDILTLVLSDSLVLAVAGVSVGLVGSLLLGRFLAALLFETSSNDPETLAIAAIFLAVAVLAATYCCAKRGAGVSPTTLLRHD